MTVIAKRENSFNGIRLSSKELQLIPSFTGKPDVMKALQLLPGVQTQSEGLSLMMVRGGEPGQNQYLLDNVPLIYVNHLGGFMSVFNPDMINTVDLYKGNFPASQGGRLSSIVDVTQREGNVSKHQGSFSLGITDASFSFEGPLASKKVSYMVTARKTFVDAIIAAQTALNENNSAVNAYGFHDLNAKITWNPNMKNKVSFNLYQGDDYLHNWEKPRHTNDDESNHAVQQWGNWLLSGRWNSIVNSKLYAEHILSFSRYRNKNAQQYSFMEDSVKHKIKTENSSSVNDFSFRTKWKYAFLKNWDIELGGLATSFIYEPSYIYNSAASTPVMSLLSTSTELAVFIENKIKLLKGLQIQPSFRFSYYSNKGFSFPSIEPRISLSYDFNPEHSLNLNYMRVTQNSHLIFAQSILIKKEIWLPADTFLPQQTSNQYSCSWKGSFLKDKYSTETNLYYKNMNYLTTLKEGYENLYGITGIENKLETGGIGVAYGLKFQIKKNVGKWKGSASYSWSHATRQFANINGGKVYEFDFNRPHSFCLNINRELNDSWNINAVWILQSGIPFTPALGKQYTYNINSNDYTYVGMIYGTKNSGRMQPYHRLDLGFAHNVTTSKGYKAIWTYSLYNAYNHINPYNYYYDNDNDTRNETYNDRPLQLYKIGLFTLMPSISYKVYFDYTHKSEPKAKKKKSWLFIEN